MSKKESKRENKKTTVFTKETVGVLLILFSALFLFVLITWTSVFGDLGSVLGGFFYGAFGKFAFGVLLYGVYGGVLLVIGKKHKLKFKYRLFATLAIICIVAFIQVIEMGSISSYGEYLSTSYNKGKNGFVSATVGGWCTGLYAYIFSRFTVAGGCVILGVLTAICVYEIVKEILKDKEDKRIIGEKKRRGAFVQNSNEEEGQSDIQADLQNGGQTATQNNATPNNAMFIQNGQNGQAIIDPVQYLMRQGYNVEKMSPVTGNRTSHLFVTDADDFAYKTKKESKNADAPTIKVQSSNGKMPFGVLNTPTPPVNANTPIGDLQKKLDYIKMPANIDLGNIISSGTNKTKPTGINGVAKDSPIPNYEHDGNKTIGDTAESRFKVFDSKYTYTQETKPTIPTDKVESTEQLKRNLEKERTENLRENLKAETHTAGAEEETFTPLPTDRVSRGENLRDNTRENTRENIRESVRERLKGRERTGFGETPRTERIRHTEEEDISKIIFGDENEEKKAESNEGKEAYQSRVEKDGNGTVLDIGASRREERKIEREEISQTAESNTTQTAEKEEEKPKKVVPINRTYNRPPLDLLQTYTQMVDSAEENHEEKLDIIRRTLEEFHINVEPQGYVQGPSITRYELAMPAGITVKNILKYDDDLKMRLASKNGVRIEAPIPGKNLVGIEVANKHRVTVGLKEVLEGSADKKSKKTDLIFALGKDIVGNSITDNLAKGPHFLVAGATGSGKSVCLNVMIVSMLMRYSPEDLRLILIDPKRVGFRVYEHLPHLMLDEIVTDPQRSLAVLAWAYEEMERRYQTFQDCEEVVSDLESYNDFVERTCKKTTPRMARIVIIIDELADLMETCKKDMESRIRALAQKARAAGIHLVLATQRPSVDIVTGTIKANLPSRIALKVMNFNDSQTILSEAGAEKLLGNGDMLYKNTAMPESERYQGAWISDREINNIVSYIIENNEAYFDDDLKEYLDKETRSKTETTTSSGGGTGEDDGEISELFLKALALAVNTGTVSISQLQRRFQIGYSRAGGLVDKMERMGLVSANEGSKARRVLISREDYESQFGTMPDDF